MGVLETRNLDFDHLLILSCNEGNMPKGVNDTSFIPYNIRRAYGLTTIDHKIAIYSYYFHRLLQRAKDITILYNNATSEGHTSEMSRFMLQMMVESPHTFSFKNLYAEQRYSPFLPQSVEKTEKVMEILRRTFETSYNLNKTDQPLLTPTAINRYMRCQLQFYYYYVCNLHELENIEDDSIDNRIFGNIFHQAAQTIYNRVTEKSRLITQSDIEKLLKNKVDIERAVDEAFQKELFKVPNTQGGRFLTEHMNGLQLINREVIIHYLRQLLRIDTKLAPFNIIGLECSVMAAIETPHIKTTIGGWIDRLDQVSSRDENTGTTGQCIRVVDYKTGGRRLTPLADVDAIFTQENIEKHSDYYLQTFLYACIIRTSKQLNPQKLPVSPALLFIQHANADDYDPVLKFGDSRINDVEDNRRRFGELLSKTVDDIFNPDISFQPTENRQRCQWCPYKLLCNKK